MTMKAERVFLIVMLVMIVLVLSSCALLDKLRGVANPHAEILIEVPVITEDVRG